MRRQSGLGLVVLFSLFFVLAISFFVGCSDDGGSSAKGNDLGDDFNGSDSSGKSSNSNDNSYDSKKNMGVGNGRGYDKNGNIILDSGSIKYGGHTYKTVTIGDMTWFAENLAIETPHSGCPSDNKDTCAMLGRVYGMYDAFAIDSTGLSTEEILNAKGFPPTVSLNFPYHQGICPDGWHVSSQGDWLKLVEYAGKNSIPLMVKESWKDTSNIENFDIYGFHMYATIRGTDSQGYQTLFWMTPDKAVYDRFGYNIPAIRFYLTGRACVNCFSGAYKYASVRCVLNDEDKAKWDAQEPIEENNSITDPRDGNRYKITKIGRQTWMAENLRYVDSASYLDLNNAVKCSKDSIKKGCLYSDYSYLGIGIDNYTQSAPSSKDYRGICPAGWRLPNNRDWAELYFGLVGKDISFIKEEFYDSVANSACSKTNVMTLLNDHGFNVSEDGEDFASADLSRANRYGGFSISNSIRSAEWAGRACFVDGYSEMAVRCLKNDYQDTIVDSRNGQSYHYVQIGEQTWTAENLNYPIDGSTMVPIACDAWRRPSCHRYGVKYDVDSLFAWLGKGEKLCPNGWHLPSKRDWMDLNYFLNPNFNPDQIWMNFFRAGVLLYSTLDPIGSWKYASYANIYGFNILVDKEAPFMTSDKSENSLPLLAFVENVGVNIAESSGDSTYVRCLKDK